VVTATTVDAAVESSSMASPIATTYMSRIRSAIYSAIVGPGSFSTPMVRGWVVLVMVVLRAGSSRVV